MEASFRQRMALCGRKQDATEPSEFFRIRYAAPAAYRHRVPQAILCREAHGEVQRVVHAAGATPRAGASETGSPTESLKRHVTCSVALGQVRELVIIVVGRRREVRDLGRRRRGRRGGPREALRQIRDVRVEGLERGARERVVERRVKLEAVLRDRVDMS